MAAAYRFTDNENVTFDKILAPHAAGTIKRMTEHPVVLVVQDTTEVDLTRPEQQVAGAGTLDGGNRRGVLLHAVGAFSVGGTPLGTLSAQIINRTDEPGEKKTKAKKDTQRRNKPIEERESMRWLTGLARVREAAEQLPDTQLIGIADSEADIYELLTQPRTTTHGRSIDFIIRACQNRALNNEIDVTTDTAVEQKTSSQKESGKQSAKTKADDKNEPSEQAYLRETVLASPVLYTVQMPIRARVAKTTIEKKSRHKSRDARTVTMNVRAVTVQLRPPKRVGIKLEPVTVNVVMVREINTPEGEEPVEWMLLTTLPIDTLEAVKKVVEFYCRRWNIEIFFRTLKSGCRIEYRQFENIDRIECMLGLYLIVAWRTMHVCWMGRECPDIDCEAIFEPSEWKSVYMATQRKKPPKKHPTLRDILLLIAQLGGYVQQKNTNPGTQTVWIGMQRMYDLAMAWDAFGPETRLKGA